MLKPNETDREEIIRTIFGEDFVHLANSSKFKTYFYHYCFVVCPASSGDAVIEFDTPVLIDHSDVLRCVKIIIQNPQISFDEFVAKAVDPKSSGASLREKEHVAKVAVEVTFAINCMPRDYYRNNFINGTSHHARWEQDVPFLSFVENAFKFGSQQNPTKEQQSFTETVAHKSCLKAWKLTKRYGIKIKRTYNLLEHLELDSKSMTLKIFHQVSFIRAHLEKSKQESLNLNFEESLRRQDTPHHTVNQALIANYYYRGTLPPKLLLETLLTFHDILFPVASIRDKRSRAALETMIQKHGFDAEGRWIEFVRSTPADMTFDYWGDRLSALYDIVKEPPPANAIVAWVERHTSERNALTVAIVGLFLSVLFGLLSFIVGLLQLILAWVAYKYPPG